MICMVIQIDIDVRQPGRVICTSRKEGRGRANSALPHSVFYPRNMEHGGLYFAVLPTNGPDVSETADFNQKYTRDTFPLILKNWHSSQSPLLKLPGYLLLLLFLWVFFLLLF